MSENSNLLNEKDKKAESMIATSIASFGVQYNYTNTSIAFLFLKNDQSNKWSDYEQLWNGNIDSILKSIVFAGSIFGMCMMGYIGDKFGRNYAFAITSLIMVIFAILPALIPQSLDTNNAMIIFAICRFFIGFGIGGCYPLSAAKSAEESNSSLIWERNKRTSISFFWMSVGGIAPYLVGMAIFQIIFLLGAIPPLYVLIATFNKKESDEFEQQRQNIKSFKEQIQIGFDNPNIINDLIGTGVCWFIYDVAYYGNNQFTPTMCAKIFTGDDIFSESLQSSVSFTIGIPATILAIYNLKTMGTKNLQFYGFIFIALTCFLIAIFWNYLTQNSNESKNYILFSLYLLFQFSVNWGPNLTTFVLPQEVFPVQIRSTFNGFAAGMGKFGAIAGIWIFDKINEWLGVIWLMIIVGALNIIGALLSFYFISKELWAKQQLQYLKKEYKIFAEQQNYQYK